MTLRTVLLIALGSFLAGLAVCIEEHRAVLVAVEGVAFLFAAPEFLAHMEALGRARRTAGTAGRGA